MEQQSLLDFIDKLANSCTFDAALEQILTEEDVPFIREYLLIETTRSAFGESRGGRKRKPSDEAWQWIISDEGELPFSFEQCCHDCGVDPELMLEWLRFYKRKLSR